MLTPGTYDVKLTLSALVSVDEGDSYEKSDLLEEARKHGDIVELQTEKIS